MKAKVHVLNREICKESEEILLEALELVRVGRIRGVGVIADGNGECYTDFAPMENRFVRLGQLERLKFRILSEMVPLNG